MKKENLLLRQAQKKDSRLIYDWQVDPFVRNNSFNTSQFSFESHNDWFEEKIKDDSCYFLLFSSIDIHNIGLIRLEKHVDHWLVGVIVAPEARGLGFGKRLIKKGSDWALQRESMPVIAQIRKENIVSINAFKKAGYRYDSEKEIKGCKAEQYIYDNR